MAGFVFGAQVEEAVESGWGIASVVLLAAMILLAVFAWWRVNRIGARIPKTGEQPT
jgi:membrane-associated protein